MPPTIHNNMHEMHKKTEMIKKNITYMPASINDNMDIVYKKKK